MEFPKLCAFYANVSYMLCASVPKFVRAYVFFHVP